MRRVTFSLALLLASTACGDSNALEHEDTHISADTQTEIAEDTMPPEEVEPVDAGPAPHSLAGLGATVPFLDDQTLSGNIADGAAVEMGWADELTVACWTILHQDKFRGHQVYFALDRALQKSSQLTITLTPTDGVDLNLYAVAQPIDATCFHLISPRRADASRAMRATRAAKRQFVSKTSTSR